MKNIKVGNRPPGGCVAVFGIACSGNLPPHPTPLPRSTGGEGTMIVTALRSISAFICHLLSVISH